MLVKAICKEIKFYDENTGFVIFKTKDNKILKGKINLSPETFLDIEVEFIGEYKTDKYGESFNFTEYKYNIDDISIFLKELVKYLPNKAVEEIIAKYKHPLKIIEAIEKKDEELLNINGITKEKLEKIYSSFREKKELISLATKLLPFGLTENTIKKLYKKYGNEAYEKVMNNPYSLTEINGYGFKKVDDIAIKIGIPLNDKNRIKESFIYALEEIMSDKGDTLIDKKDLLKETAKLLNNKKYKINIKTNELELILEDLIKEGRLIEIEGKISTKKVFLVEKYLIDNLFTPIKNYKLPFKDEYLINFIADYQKKENLKLSKEQIEAIVKFAVTDSSVFVLSGYAGTGKTTVSKAIIEIYNRAFKALNIKQAIKGGALSGCAANRLKNVAQIDSKTIHSLLKFNGKEFFYNEKNKLPYKLIVIDEASMVDIFTFYALIKAIDLKKTKLFLIGDNAQLPPVGQGEIFNDLLKYGNLPKVELTKIFRQKDNRYIKTFSAYIREGNVPKDLYSPKEDFLFERCDIPNYFQLKKSLSEKELAKLRKNNNIKILNTIKGHLSLYANLYQKYFKEKNFIKMVELVQILSPMKDNILGTDFLNKIAQEILNPPYFSKKEINYNNKIFRMGDKVIHIKNVNKNVRIPSKDFQNERVYNGQLGIITNINDKEMIEVFYPYENYFVYYSKNELNLIQHGYSLTIHKSQGSQYENVIMPISNSHYIMLNNKILYTGVTRAKNNLIIVGESYALSMGIKRKDETQRKTFSKFLNKKNDENAIISITEKTENIKELKGVKNERRKIQ